MPRHAKRIMSAVAQGRYVLIPVLLFALASPAGARTVLVRFTAPPDVARSIDWSQFGAEWYFLPKTPDSLQGNRRGRFEGAGKSGTHTWSAGKPGTLEVTVVPSMSLPLRGGGQITIQPEQMEAAEPLVLEVPLRTVKRNKIVVRVLDERTGQPLVSRGIELADPRKGILGSFARTDDNGKAILTYETEGEGYSLHFRPLALDLPWIKRDLTQGELRNGFVLWRVSVPRVVWRCSLRIQGDERPENADLEALTSRYSEPTFHLRLSKDRAFWPTKGEGNSWYLYEHRSAAGTCTIELSPEWRKHFELLSPKTTEIPSPDEQPTEVTILLRKRELVDVTITFPGVAQDETPVSLWIRNDLGTWDARTDEKGAAHLPDIPVGVYYLTTKSPDRQDIADKELNISGDNHAFTLALEPSFECSVTFRDDSRTPENTVVRVLEWHPSKLRRLRAEFDNDGHRWICRDLNPGKHSILVHSPNGLAYVSDVFDVPDNIERNIELPETTILTGQVHGLTHLPPTSDGIAPRSKPTGPEKEDTRIRGQVRLAFNRQTRAGLSSEVLAAWCEIDRERPSYTCDVCPGEYRVYLIYDYKAWLIDSITVSAAGGSRQVDFKVSPDLLANPISPEDLVVRELKPRE